MDRPRRTVLLFLDLGVYRHINLHPQGRILKCNVDGSGLETVLDHIPGLPDGLVVDPTERYIYLTQMGPPGSQCGQISRVDIATKEFKVLVPQGLTWSPKQITLDRKSRRLYWADREGGKIWSCDVQGTDPRIEIQVVPEQEMGEENIADMGKWCVGVAVDTRRQKLYWTQKGAPKGGAGSLWTAGLNKANGEAFDARTDKICLLEYLPEPIDIDLDEENNILYMTDRGEIPFGNSVARLDLNHIEEGLETNIIVEKLHEGVGIAHDSITRRLYITDLMGGVYVTREDGTQKQTILSDVGELAGITICHDWDRLASL